MGILLQGVEKQEIDYFLSKIQKSERKVIGGFEFYFGKINDREVVISKTKVGEINASIATTIAIQSFKIDKIINQGTAGSHSVDVRRGDCVVVCDYVQINSYETVDGEYRIRTFNTDDIIAKREYDNNFIKEIFDKISSVSERRIHLGKIASGDVWNKDVNIIKKIHKDYDTLGEEMEIAGVYSVADSFKIPVVGVRIISNNSLLDEGYDPAIASECQKLICKII